MPEGAGNLFGPRLSLAQEFVAALAASGISRGLVGPKEMERLWDRHILNSAVVANLVDGYTTVIDVGSGAGFPGLVLAILRPETDVVLVESMNRRANWLEEVSASFELKNVEVKRSRIELLSRKELVSPSRRIAVTVRAVASLKNLVTWISPILFTGEQIIAVKGKTVVDEVNQIQGSKIWSNVSRATVIATSDETGHAAATVALLVRSSYRQQEDRTKI
ncbi:MAG: 16S rRNA (guanine(527)-N(7))-methyltransferase RsmG [Angustibacter sp.]